MHFRNSLLALPFVALCATATAGGFVALPESDPLRINGTNNPATDPYYLGDGWLPESNGYEQVARRISSVLYDGADIGTFYDYVYRDGNDGSLLFASRFTLEVEEQNGYVLEINDLFRRGFNGYDVSAAWYDADAGRRLTNAALTAVGRTRPQVPDEFDPDVVDLRTDISIEEGNPATAWYVIKTDATAFRYLVDAVSVSQAAGASGDDPPLRIGTFEGFAPAAPVPEPTTYALVLAGLGLLSLATRRRC